jgi:hypothetical protein
VAVQQGRQGGTVLGGVEHENQGAEVGGVLDVGLRGVKEGVDVEEGGGEGQGQIRMIGAQVLQ